MAGRKLTARAEEEVVFMENLLVQCDHLTKLVEEYAAAKKNQDAQAQTIARQLSQIRQQAMIKNLGPIADQAGLLSVAAGRGSQMQRARTMREGVAGFKQLLERTMKATIEADQRLQAEAEKEKERQRAAERAAAQRMAERALRESAPQMKAPPEAERPAAPAEAAGQVKEGEAKPQQ
jgi:hypothetical protein